MHILASFILATILEIARDAFVKTENKQITIKESRLTKPGFLF
jgi:hypothetical protein